MLGHVTEITGRVIERSQSLMKSDGVFYQFIKIASDDGNIYHVRHIIVGSDNNMDVISGEECTFYIKGFRNLGTGFFKRHAMLASKSSRGVSFGLKKRMFVGGIIFGLLASALLSPFLWWFGYLIAAPILAPFFGPNATFVAGAWPILAVLHVSWTYLSLLIDGVVLKTNLLGVSGNSQVLPSGKVVKTL